MSALSEQCEVLRLWAKHLREGEPILASDLREAADTILNLRDMAQQAQSEKAALERRIDELCAEVEALRRDEWSAGFNAGCDAVNAAIEDGKSHYEAENAKLRELVDEPYPLADYGAMDASELDRAHDLMRDLGIEVTE